MRRRGLRIIAFILAVILSAGSPSGSTAAETGPAKRGTLVIGILTIESSYARNTERPSRGAPDTVQFWLGPGGAWRIRTYATDHDLHPHSLGDLGKMKDRPLEFAREHIQKNYGDVLASTVVLELADVSDTPTVRRVLAQHKLKGRLEIARSGFAFWNPDGGHYRTRTRPDSRGM
jgi:hypothetical protein